MLAPIATSVAAVAGAAAVGYGIGTLIYNGVAVPIQDALEIAFPYSTASGGGGYKPPQPPASTTGGCPPEEPRKFSKNKSPGKWANQLQQRGWTLQQIEDAIQNGQRFPAQNLINPANGATRYVSLENGQSVSLIMLQEKLFMSADQGSNTELIYIPLLDEGVSVVRPTRGRALGNGKFLVLETADYDRETEAWEFPPGSVVSCVLESHDKGDILVARSLVDS